MPLKVSYEHRDQLVVVRPQGEATLDEFVAMLQQVGAESVRWNASSVVVDLRGISTLYTFAEQQRIGEAVARNLSHLRKAAAVVEPARITRVGEQAARERGASVLVFADEDEAVAWCLA